MAYLGIPSFGTIVSNVDTFSGDGSTTSFSRASSNSLENLTSVYIDGVYQEKTEYSTSGTNIVFSTAPANSTSIEVISLG